MRSLNETPIGKSQAFSIFSYGFRPFFLASSLYAILPLIPWMLYLMGEFQPNTAITTWHAHEMLFGFVGAGISGFLLTSMPKWTNTPPLTGKGLKQLFGFWLAGRLAFWAFLFFEHPIFGYLLFLDLLLPLAQTLRIRKLLVSTENKRNYIFIAILAALVVANFLIILDLNNITSNTASLAAILAPNIIMITIAVIGGRVTYSFTHSYFQKTNQVIDLLKFPVLEKAALYLLVLNAIVDLIIPHSIISYTVAFIACIAHGLRLLGWKSLKTFNNPMVWVLHLGYFWLVFALFLKASEGVLDLPHNLYLHAFTLGAVGTYMLGIMTRAALGHTGRDLIASPIIVVSYLLISLAALIRILCPLFPDLYTYGMGIASLLWVISYTIYLTEYTTILTSPRVDGQPG